ncbi:MAG: phosphatidylserine decarboxylase [Candidatus Aminicenantales bacterium]
MRAPYRLEYFDRREGCVKTDAVPAARITRWIHNTRSGRWAGRWVFGTAAVSRFYGWIQKTRWSKRRIGPLIEKFGIDSAESTRPVGDYASFHDFFVRDIDLTRRPFVPDPDFCAAPVDGRFLAYPDVSPDQTFPVKQAVFNLREFLRNDSLAEEFAGGTLVVSRLGMGDYHYVHFPFSGTPRLPVSLPGKYHPSGPYSPGRLIPFYRDNHRMITRIDSDRFDRALIIEVGAFAVGAIRQLFRPDAPAAKGEKKARFEPGGSTVVLLFKKGAIAIEADLLGHSSKGMETYVRLGDSVGRKPSSPRREIKP